MNSGGDLLDFNYSMAHPQGTTGMTLAIREGKCERKVILNFLVVSCKSAFRGIMGRFFLENLDMVASHVHLKLIYHKVKESWPLLALT